MPDPSNPPIKPPGPSILIDHDKMRQVYLIFNGMPADVIMEHLSLAMIETVGLIPTTTDGKPPKIDREGYDCGPWHRNVSVKVQADRLF